MSTLHSRNQHSTVQRIISTMFDDEKSKVGFRSSHFYRTRIRGVKCNGLVFSVSVALATLCIYYLAYWRNDAGVIDDIGKDNEANPVVVDDGNPRFDGLNRHVDVNGYDERGQFGLKDPQRGKDRMDAVRNPVKDGHLQSNENRFQPPGKGGAELNDPLKRQDKIRVNQPIRDEQVPNNEHRYQGQRQDDLDDSPRREDLSGNRKPIQSNEQRYNPHRDGAELRNQGIHSNEKRFQPREDYDEDDKEDNDYEDEIYDGRDHRLPKRPAEDVHAGGQHGNRYDDVPDYSNEMRKVPNVHKVVPHHPKLKSFGKDLPKIIPIGPDNDLVLNQGDKSNDVKRDKVDPKPHNVLEEQPQQVKKDYPLQKQLEVDPDYRAVQLNNMDRNNEPKLPKFKPYKHINPKAEDFANMKPKPRPRDFPVTLLQTPSLKSCPSKPFVLIVVISEAHHTEARKIIRKTWGSPGSFRARHIDQVELSWWVVFAIGSKTSNKEMERESTDHHDILQGDFLDLESEETRKVMMAMKWVYDLKTSNPECHPDYVLKTGSHVFVNTPVLTSWIKNILHQETNVYAGKLITNDDPIRDPTHPHFVPYSDFKDEFFPTLVGGPTYLMSTDVVYRMVPLFESVTPIAMDDSYIGILAAELGVAPHNDDRFIHPKRPSNVCHYKSIMLIFGVSPSEIRHIFSVVMGKSGRHCLKNGL